MAHTGLSSTYTLASLPKPLDTKHGCIRAAPVYSLRGHKKRKRHELAVGIDGEAINILNIQTQNVVSSYALPPQSYLACSPQSVYVRSRKAGLVRRHTFVVLKDGAKSQHQKLACFAETIDRRRGALSEGRPVKIETSIRSEKVVSIDIIAREQSDDTIEMAGILIVYRDGAVDCISADLATVVWAEQARSEEITACTAIFDARAARKGLLAGREDVVAILGPHVGAANTSNQTSQTLCKVVIHNQKLNLRLYKIRPPSPNTLQSSRSGLELVMETQLPPSSGILSENASCELNVTTGKLYQLDHGRLAIFDLSSTVPQVIPNAGPQRVHMSRFSRLSSNLLVAIVDEKAVLLETRYGSIQDVVSLKNNSTLVKRAGARNDSLISSFEIICGFAELNAVVGISGQDLIMVQFAQSGLSNGHSRLQSSLLTDAAGKGIAADSLRLARTLDGDLAFSKWIQELDRVVSDADNAALERLVAEVLNLKTSTSEALIRTGKVQTDNDNDNDNALTAQSFDIRTVDRRKVLCILAKSVHTRKTSTKSLDDAVLAPSMASTEVYKWLALTGFFSPTYLNQALRNPRSKEAKQIHLASGDIMSIVSRYDTNLQLLYEMLALPVHWDVEEVVQALKTIAQSFDVGQGNEALALSPPPSLTDDADENSIMADADIESVIENESRAAEQEVTHAETTLSHGLEIRSAALQLTLARLHAFPPKSVTRAMRARMDYQEIIFFINVLRIELANGHWTRRYVDGDDDSAHENGNANDVESPPTATANRAVCAIADMLNCAVDAIGTSGWLVGLSGDALGTQELINAIRAEVSAGLEGCYEATLLTTFLGELERYEALASREVLDEVSAGGYEKAVMPVGGRTEAPVIRGRDTKNDERLRKHKIRRERMLRAGKYSFDRIRI